MEEQELSERLTALGCPADKSLFMAQQLDKRAKQLSAAQNRSYDEVLAHLLSLFKQGWAAQGLTPED